MQFLKGYYDQAVQKIPQPEMLAVIVIVTFLDALTTYIILFLGGEEFNPFMANIYPNPGILVAIKMIYIIVIYGMAVFVESHIKKSGWLVVLITSFITSIGVINNIIVLMLHGV